MKLPSAPLAIVVILLGGGSVARGQADISANLETYRTNRHMPDLMAVYGH